VCVSQQRSVLGRSPAAALGDESAQLSFWTRRPCFAFPPLLPQERTKFEKETRVNVAGRRGRSSLAEKK
jgi:hypothetical protein